MDIYGELDRQKTLELTSLYRNIDVIIDISDLSSLDSTTADLSQIFIDYAFGAKDDHIKRFLIVGFRGEKVHVGRVNTWKTLEEVLVQNDIDKKHEILASNMKNNKMDAVIMFENGKAYPFNLKNDIRLEQ